ncbi:MAG: hypothetical protein IIA44_12865, partial [Acidobacteria bacterium]|nr:hypothetical protein [Acidobacteriota bacterium]
LSGRRDFEGYRLYVARIDAAEHYALIASWDRPDDFVRFDYFPRYTDWRRRSHPDAWKQTSHPATTAEWQEILGEPDFDPRDYAEREIETAYVDTTLDTIRDPLGRILRIEVREQYSYWEPVDANQGNTYWDGTGWRDNIIRQIAVRDTIIADDTLTYGVYEATISNLMGGDPIYIGVTTFDQGDYENNLDAQESSPQANNEYVFQIYSADVVADSGLKVAVYPNPYQSRYRGRDGNWTNYYAEGFEASGMPTWSPLDRRIWFAHLPDTATIRIYSLDGDLIREIRHPDPMFSPYNSAAYWDLISRNQQAVRSGIYIYRIDSRLPVQMGKLVIIR